MTRKRAVIHIDSPFFQKILSLRLIRGIVDPPVKLIGIWVDWQRCSLQKKDLFLA
jgi:hypothetical protein